MQKAVSLAKAVVRHVRSGHVLSQAHQEARLAVCKECEQWTGKKCRLCGCDFMKAKLAMSEEKCPHPSGNKWAAVDSRFKENVN